MGGSSSNEVKKTEAEKEALRVAAERWNFSQQHLAPLMDQYLAQTDAMKSGEALGYQRGRANESMQMMQGQQRDQVNQHLNQSGVDPSSGRAQMTNTQLTAMQGGSAGDAMGRTQGEQLNQHVMGLQNAVNIGQGRDSQAQMGLGQIANTQANLAQQNAFGAHNRRSANMQLLGSVAGATTSYGLENNWFGGDKNK